MPYTRQAIYPYPKNLKDVPSIISYLDCLYRSLLENEGVSEYLADVSVPVQQPIYPRLLHMGG